MIYDTDPMAAELLRCGLPLNEVDAIAERAAILEHLAKMDRDHAEMVATGGGW